MLSQQDEKFLAKFVRYEEPPFDDRQVKEIRGLLDVANLPEILARVHPDLAAMLRQSIALHPLMKGVGYWRSPDETDLPDPTRLVMAQPSPDASKIASYLRSGAVYAQWRGVSWCRFRCEHPLMALGTQCLTDGQWVWPEGLAHYIEHHCVALPEEFTESMRHNGWIVPAVSAEVTHDFLGTPNRNFWKEWGNIAMHATQGMRPE